MRAPTPSLRRHSSTMISRSRSKASGLNVMLKAHSRMMCRAVSSPVRVAWGTESL